MRKHSERCKECKVRVFELLVKIYGQENVLENHNLQLPNKVEQFKPNDLNPNLENIFHQLQKYREHAEFVRSKRLPNVDYFVKDKFILEFDESQHFTKPRLLALENYSDKLSLGYKKEKWMELCEKLNKKDNDPPFRDEQRAWYDTLRDFAPTFLGIKPTIRLFASDYVWCSLDANKKDDIEIFKELIGQK
ncbi:MAG: hypothetical protein DRI89_12035 [Bacteroidetes bacterium]|nr:MAG: hypothetical protein DRI89_12035 [Bacteroidota bacterium]